MLFLMNMHWCWPIHVTFLYSACINHQLSYNGYQYAAQLHFDFCYGLRAYLVYKQAYQSWRTTFAVY